MRLHHPRAREWRSSRRRWSGRARHLSDLPPLPGSAHVVCPATKCLVLPSRKEWVPQLYHMFVRGMCRLRRPKLLLLRVTDRLVPKLSDAEPHYTFRHLGRGP